MAICVPACGAHGDMHSRMRISERAPHVDVHSPIKLVYSLCISDSAPCADMHTRVRAGLARARIHNRIRTSSLQARARELTVEIVGGALAAGVDVGPAAAVAARAAAAALGPSHATAAALLARLGRGGDGGMQIRISGDGGGARSV